MKRKEQQQLLELIVNSKEKQQGNFTLTAQLVCDLLREYFDGSIVSVWLFKSVKVETSEVDDHVCIEELVASTLHSVNDSNETTYQQQTKISQQYFKALKKHRFLLTPECQQQNILAAFLPYYLKNDINTALDIAIRINGYIEGVLTIEHSSIIAWSKNDIQIATQVADQLALTLATRYAADKNEAIYLFRNAAEQAEHVIMLVNTRTRMVEYVNNAHEQMTGLPRNLIENHSVLKLDIFRHTPDYLDVIIEKLHQGEVVKGNAKLKRHDGKEYWLHYHISPFITEQGNEYALVSSYDNSADFLNKAELERLAWHCSLTSLHNRSFFIPQLDKAGSGLLILIDLLGFKRFNDTHGHQVGDLLLIEIARRLKHFAQQYQAVDLARIGSDEFAVILPEQASDFDVDGFITKLYNSLLVPSVISNQKVEPKPAIALVDIASVVGHFNPLSCADITLQHAKRKSHKHYQIFNDELLQSFKNSNEIELDLKKAIKGREFELYYQPLLDLKTKTVMGAEALIRWHHPKKGVLYPGAFIEIAEQSDMITQIGEWVLETACKQLYLWQHKDVDMVMNVNVAPRQFFSGALFEQVWELITRYKLKPNTLMLEITETELMGDIQYATNMCNELADLGVGLAIDDFGTGYSSMKYLKQFPISKLKIDRSFIMDISSSHESREIVSAIIAMAKALNISLTAEGVETKEQEEFLSQSECHHAQGYLYSPAIRVGDFGTFMTKHANGFTLD